MPVDLNEIRRLNVVAKQRPDGAAQWAAQREMSKYAPKMANEIEALVKQRDALLYACEMAIADAGEKSDGRTIDKLTAAIAACKSVNQSRHPQQDR